MLIGLDASRAASQQRTGTEAYAFFLIQALMPLLKEKGHRLRLYFNQPPAKDLFPAADHVEQVVIPWPRMWTHVRLAWELRRRPPDVFFTPAHVIPFTFRAPSVATVHDLGYHHFPDAHEKRQLAYLRWSTRHNGRVARRVVADSQATKADLIRFDGIDSRKIDVIYPGVDPDLQPVEDETRLAAVFSKYGITPPYLLFLGTLQPRKNLVRLVRAFVDSQVTQQLVLAGKQGWLAGPILAEIDQLPATSDQAPRIITPGFIDDADKAALLSGSTALLYPSLYEGFGFPVLEAGACGLPVICANTSSLPEVAGEAALLVDPLAVGAISAAIRRLAGDPLLRNELTLAGRENVKRFTWQETAVRVLQTLERAADQHSIQT